MPWYFFALVTPILYSSTNFMDKFLIEKRIKNPIYITILGGLVSGILGIIIWIFTYSNPISTLSIFGSVLAGLLLTFYLMPYYKALKLEDSSRIVPLFQFIPVFTLILSTIILKETLSLKQIVGLIIVVVSGFFLSLKKIEGRVFKPRKSLWYMLLASFMYGCVGILFRLTVKDSNYWTVLSYEYIGTGIGGLILFFLPGIRQGFNSQLQAIKSSISIISLNQLLATLAQMSEAYAVSLAIVPLVHLIGSTGSIIVLFMGIFLSIKFPHIIKEDIRKQVILHKLISILLIFLGLYLVYR